MAKIFCAGEGDSFPEAEFLQDKKGKLFEPHIHCKSPFHYAESGEPIDPHPHKIPVPVQLLSRLKALVEKTSVADVERLIDDNLKK